MDPEDLRSILKTTGLDLWSLIDTAISIAAADHGSELRLRRDGFVERLYAPPHQDSCNKLESDDQNPLEVEKTRAREEEKGSSSPIEKAFGSSPLTPQSNHREEEEVEIDDEEDEDDEEKQKRKISTIKNALKDGDQSGDTIASLLQNLEDMNMTYRVLEDTDIGRHVNRLRKHESSEVRILVKQLISKWKEMVEEYVNPPEDSIPATTATTTTTVITDELDSPYEPRPVIPAKNSRNGNKVPDYAYSPNNPNNARVRSDSNRESFETVETKPKVAPKREAPLKPNRSSTPSSCISAKGKEEQDTLPEAERLANARKRLQENYREAQNAKKQRNIQVMDINEIPKPKNSFMARNKGGHHQGKHW